MDDAMTKHGIYIHLFTASTSVPVCAYVSKMFTVRRSEVPEEKDKERAAKVKASKEKRSPTPMSDTLPAEPERKEGTVDKKTEYANKDDNILLGFARIYSGTLSVGKRVCVLLPKFNHSLESSTLSANNLESSLGTLDITEPSGADDAKSDADSGIAKLSVQPLKCALHPRSPILCPEPWWLIIGFGTKPRAIRFDNVTPHIIGFCLGTTDGKSKLTFEPINACEINVVENCGSPPTSFFEFSRTTFEHWLIRWQCSVTQR
ncbi:hypothetical protein BDP27DRAFT_1426260 [Rhodocollybia butyracea]|uniref:Uncharacterized protein n=1 Tax=Rhodocollybia butyracea TaxID=206335 RepID=A0A9P5PEZ3_9AGAR|nr:hypothetical protein BDP27DRAFT_1426260 [Rhodocollybia butyracea]